MRIPDSQIPIINLERRSYTLKELHAIYGVGVGVLRIAIQKGELRAVKLGRIVFVMDEDWKAYLHAREIRPAHRISTGVIEPAESAE